MSAMIRQIDWPKNLEQWRSIAAKAAGICAASIGLVLPISTSLTEIFFYAAAILGIVSGIFYNKWRIIFHSHMGAILLLLYLLLLFSIIYSTATLTTAIDGLFKYNKFLLCVLIMPIFVDNRWRAYALKAFIFSVAVILLWSYAAIFRQIYLHLPLDATVVKNHIAQNFSIALGAYLFAETGVKYKKRWWLFAPLCLLAVTNVLFLSAGRSGYLVLGLLLILFFWQHIGKRGTLIAALCLLVLCMTAFFTSSIFHTRIIQISQDYHAYNQGNIETSTGERLSFAIGALKVIKQNPVLGTGVGSFGRQYALINPQVKISTANPHNEYLNIGSQLGVIGIALMLVMFIAGWWQAEKLSTYYLHIARATILIYAIGALINSWFMDITEGFTFAYLIAITFAAINSKNTADTV